MPDMSRRTFLFLTGGTGAAAAVEPGRQFVNKLIPYVIPPEKIPPGEWVHFATTCRECPAGCGMHMRHRDGRVSKPEGNPRHPVNLGGLCPRGQSSVQGLYDPDRVRQVTRQQEGVLTGSSWASALSDLSRRLRDSGGRVAILSDLQTGALAEVMAAFARAFEAPDRLLFYEAFNYEPIRAAHQSLFGRSAIPRYRLDDCELVISFAADFLETWISPVEFARRFADLHSLQEGRIGRFAYVGPRLSMTAASADEFVHVPPEKVRWVALAMAQAMVEKGWARDPQGRLRSVLKQMAGESALQYATLPPARIEELARMFAQARRKVALPGPMAANSPVARDTALAVALLNAAGGNLGETVDFGRVHALGRTATDEELKTFAAGLTPEDVLFIHNANPFFSRGDLAKDLRRAGTVVHLTSLPDETAEAADWILPIDTPPESWGDYEPWTGFHCLLQPTMQRLHHSRMAGDILMAVADAAGKPLTREGGGPAPENFAEWLALRWRDLHASTASPEPFSDFWEASLRRGGYFAELPAGEVEPAESPDLQLHPPSDEAAEADRVDLWLWPSILLFDGRPSNRGWLQETPHPVSTIAWGSWVDLHPRKAAELKVRDGEVVEISTVAGTVEVPVRITDEVSESVAAIPLGQGHTSRFLRVAAGVGANPFRLLGGKAEGMFARGTLHPSGREERPACVSATRQQHHREILQTVSLAEAKRLEPGEGEPLILPTPAGYDPGRDLYAPHDHKKHRWAMAIDLQRCIGCHGCAVACYAENNIPVVGKQRVAEGLEMAWLRVPPYRHQKHPHRISWLPLPCQHCDAAPCEPVCPVFAAVHNEEGLNAQIYNRCIGTRYCNNNCPYKVRRFNWYATEWRPPLEMQLNPEVTVRSRGVMEKCTFCVQRIRQAEHRARLEKREVRDGEIQPACVQSCPARVFTFGDLNNPDSAVYRIFHEDPRRYQVLHELNTKPAVAYLRKIHVGG